MPGPVSESSKGPRDDAPYVPSWCYPRGAKMCPCGHHEGYHTGPGSVCLHAQHFTKCGCAGLPVECFSTDDEMWADTPLLGDIR